jgi:hypothetical protein
MDHNDKTTLYGSSQVFIAPRGSNHGDKISLRITYERGYKEVKTKKLKNLKTLTIDQTLIRSLEWYFPSLLHLKYGFQE